MISLSSFMIICFWIYAYFRKYCQYRFHILNVVCWGGSGQSTFRLHQFSLCCRKSHALIIVRESVYGPIQLFHNYTISVDRAWQGIKAFKCSISHFLSIWTQKSEDERFYYWFLYTFFLDGESSTVKNSHRVHLPWVYPSGAVRVIPCLNLLFDFVRPRQLAFDSLRDQMS